MLWKRNSLSTVQSNLNGPLYLQSPYVYVWLIQQNSDLFPVISMAEKCVSWHELETLVCVFTSVVFFISEYILTGLWYIQKYFCLSKNSMLPLWNHHNNSLSNSPLLFQVYMNDWSVHSNLLFGARIQIGWVTWFPLTPMVAAWCQRPCPKWHPKPLWSSSESALSWRNAALTDG